jgi:hypothetical protein
MNARAALALCALGVAATAEVGSAQSLGLAAGRDLPAWMTDWSPLVPRADLPHLLPSTSAAQPLLLLPAPKVGLFWLTGNPGAFPAEVGEEYTNFMVAKSGQDGDYRRPLDPGGASLTQFSALSWRPVGTRAAAIGRVIVDQETQSPGTYSDVVEPYASSPFVVTDTTMGQMRRVRARFEGAAGARVGRWGLGAALGYETRNDYTVRAKFVRFNTRVLPAATLGVTHRFGDSGLVLGVHGRLNRSAETVELLRYGIPGGRVYQLEGYADVVARDVPSYYRRIESDEASAGAGASGRLLGARWVVFGEVARFNEGQWSQVSGDNPAKDQWKTRTWSVGAAAQHALAGGRWLVTLEGRYTSLTGNGDLARDSAGPIIRDRNHSLSGSAEVRLLPVGNGWTGVAVISVVNERRERRDSVAGIWTNLETLTPGIAVEAGRTVLKRLFVSAGFAYATYMSRGEIPEAFARGQVYLTLIAPEIEVYATEAAVEAFSLSARWQVRDGMALWASARSESLAPTENGLLRAAGLRPPGSRTAQYLAFGVSLGGTNGEP